MMLVVFDLLFWFISFLVVDYFIETKELAMGVFGVLVATTTMFFESIKHPCSYSYHDGRGQKKDDRGGE